MELRRTETGFALYKEKEVIGHCTLHPAAQGADLAALAIDPAWRRKGYGSYLLKEVLRSFGGYDREAATVFTAPLPADCAEMAFWAKFGFAVEGPQLVRRRTPDLTAVKFVQDFLAARLVHPACAWTPPAATAATRPSCAVLPHRRAVCWALTSSRKPSPPPAPGWNRPGCLLGSMPCTATATPICYSMCSPARRMP